MKIKKLTHYLLALAIIIFSGTALMADDSDIFQSGRKISPNVLMIFDTSSSMNDSFSSTYSPSVDYIWALALWNSTNTSKHGVNTSYYSPRLSVTSDYEYKNWVYIQVGTGAKDGANTNKWKLYGGSTADQPCLVSPVSGYAGQYVLCEDARYALSSNGIWSGKCDDDGNSVCSSSSTKNRSLATANYIAYLCLQNEYKTKLNVSKLIMRDIITDSLKREGGPSMNIGLMALNYIIGYDADESYVYDSTANTATFVQQAADSTAGINYHGMEDVFFDFFLRLDHRTVSDLHGDRFKANMRNYGSDWGYISWDLDDAYETDQGLLKTKPLKRYFTTRNYSSWGYGVREFFQELPWLGALIEQDGARVVLPIKYFPGPDPSTISSYINNSVVPTLDSLVVSNANANTPLAEALAEAGLYFHGTTTNPQKSWCMPDTYYPRPTTYNPKRDTYRAAMNDNYDSKDADGEWAIPSPADPAITYRCQKNFIVLVSDGNPNNDEGTHQGKNIFGGSDYFYPTMSPTAVKSVTWSKSIDKNFLWPAVDAGYYYPQSQAYAGDAAQADSFSWTIQTNEKTNWKSSPLIEVADYLYRVGALSNSTDKDVAGQPYGTQSIRTFTIALDALKKDKKYAQWLMDTARAGHGRYYPVNSTGDLRNAFDDILDSIYTEAFGFSAVSVASSSDSEYYSGKSVYVPSFIPDANGTWKGNLKKYAVKPDGTLIDYSGNSALNSAGAFASSARDFWCTKDGRDDYNNVETGGVGEMLQGNSNRKFKVILTDAPNASIISFDKDNIQNTSTASTTKITTAQLGIINDVNAGRVVLDDFISAVTQSKSTWRLGDIMHSTPVAMNDPNYKTTKSIIFVGANDGFLHCFVDTHTADDTYTVSSNDPNSITLKNSGHSVSEEWALAPNEIISSLKFMHQYYRENLPGDHHPFYVDGSPVVYKIRTSNSYTPGEINPTDDLTYLIFGLRRGGRTYTILNIGDYTKPSVVRTINSSLVSGPVNLGQSWGTPRIGLVATYNSDQTVAKYKKVVFLPGGYDAYSSVNEDTLTGKGAAPTSRLLGSFAFAVDAQSGDKFAVFSSDSSDSVHMMNSIVDLAFFSSDASRVINRLYLPDLGGKLWRFTAPTAGTAGAASNTWSHSCIFDAGGSYPRKFFSAPDVLLERGYEYAFIGTGDREHPESVNSTPTTATAGGITTTTYPAPEEKNQERFYAIKVRSTTTHLTEADLTIKPADSGAKADVAADVIELEKQDYSDAVLRQLLMNSANGWFLRLTGKGEKVINKPITAAGIVFFTTYQPPAPATSDICASRDSFGISRLYAINYKTGSYIPKLKERFKADVDNDYLGDTSDSRSLVLGQSGLPPQPAIVANGSSVSLIVGSTSITIPTPDLAKTYYWTYNF